MTSTRAPITAWDEITLDLPSGPLELVVATDGEGLCGVRFGPAADQADWLGATPRDPSHPVLVAAAAELKSYAAGDKNTFDVPVSLYGTDFQKDVWRSLLAIPYGTTTTYGTIAERIGRPTYSRAVGAAVGANPVGIIVPCHRVIGVNGSLTGFAGGLDRKTALLALEGITAL
ncbi:MAG TPA: methylated-DNA--[protein]-cysteine S-methyltransferase [Acidimicrobiales bacterium]|jgi:methylated-DNA-[protein]-cysteine S-methyltransferase|nr:methylated-DNA--[protein]-cysteine S-methyltransferase [Acidimicrobiales bacterium]